MSLIASLPITHQSTGVSAQKVKGCSAGAAHLDHIVIEVLGVPVDQVDLLGEDIPGCLFIGAVVCHGFVVGLVDVALIANDGCRVEDALGWRGGTQRETQREAFSEV